MYTRGKARQEAVLSNSETEDEYAEAPELGQACSPPRQDHSTRKKKEPNARRKLIVHEVTDDTSQNETDTDVTMVQRSSPQSRPRQRLTKRKSNRMKSSQGKGDGQVNQTTDNESASDSGSQLTTGLTQAKETMKSFMDVFMSTMVTMQGMLTSTKRMIQEKVSPRPERSNTIVQSEEDTRSRSSPTNNHSKSKSKSKESVKSQESKSKILPECQNDSETGENTDESTTDDEQESTVSMATSKLFTKKNRQDNTGTCKLPVYTGTEKWQVWHSRLEAVASLYGWNEKQKLKQMLPRLQGAAAEYVYSQLKPTVLTDYQLLVKEMKSRFGIIETRKTYLTKFNRRVQNKGESPEDYAADLKRLYDKAHPDRDVNTKQEDLVSHFLMGLYDEQSRIHVELNKDPKTIEEAVLHVAH